MTLLVAWLFSLKSKGVYCVLLTRKIYHAEKAEGEAIKNKIAIEA